MGLLDRDSSEDDSSASSHQRHGAHIDDTSERAIDEEDVDGDELEQLESELEEGEEFDIINVEDNTRGLELQLESTGEGVGGGYIEEGAEG